MAKQRREEEERETLLRIAKVCVFVCVHGESVKVSMSAILCLVLFSLQSRMSSEDPEQLRLKQRAKEVGVCVFMFLICSVRAVRVP